MMTDHKVFLGLGVEAAALGLESKKARSSDEMAEVEKADG